MSNNLAVIVPKILARGLLALRSETVMPVLVNRDYGTEAARKGTVITIPIPSAVAARDVAPGTVPVAAPDQTPTQALVPLDQWKEAPFYLTDKELVEIDAQDTFLPMETSEAVKSLAETINAFIMSKYKGVYGYSGTAGTTPFGTANDVSDATNARKTLNNQRAPRRPRFGVLDPDAEAKALNQRAFQDYSWGNTLDVIRDGQLKETRLGIGWFMDQQTPTHVAGSFTTAGTIVTSGSGNTAGVASVLLATDAAEAVNVVEGDIISFANHTQTYVVTATTNIGASTTGSVPIAPVLQVTVPAGTVLALRASHVVNLVFHRDAFAFASRPLLDAAQGLGNIIMAMSDPVTGLTLRLEVSRQHKQTNWSFDILYGAALVRRELATRMAG
jgi:hypothetical protein